MYKPNYKFVGSNYIDGASTKEIAKLIRTELKKQFPKCKFSVTKTIIKINCTLMQAPFEAVKPVDIKAVDEIFHLENPYNETREAISNRWDDDYKKQKTHFNQYYIKENKFLTDEAKQVMQKAVEIIDSYNFDDSDSMTDYFHCNFYSEVDLGKWDKPFVVIK